MPRKDPNAQQKEGNSFLGDVLTNAGNIVADDAIKEINGEPIDLLTGGLKRAGTAGRVSAAAIEYSAEAIQDAFLDESRELIQDNEGTTGGELIEDLVEGAYEGAVIGGIVGVITGGTGFIAGALRIVLGAISGAVKDRLSEGGPAAVVESYAKPKPEDESSSMKQVLDQELARQERERQEDAAQSRVQRIEAYAAQPPIDERGVTEETTTPNGDRNKWTYSAERLITLNDSGIDGDNIGFERETWAKEVDSEGNPTGRWMKTTVRVVNGEVESKDTKYFKDGDHDGDGKPNRDDEDYEIYDDETIDDDFEGEGSGSEPEKEPDGEPKDPEDKEPDGEPKDPEDEEPQEEDAEPDPEEEFPNPANEDQGDPDANSDSPLRDVDADIDHGPFHEEGGDLITGYELLMEWNGKIDGDPIGELQHDADAVGRFDWLVKIDPVTNWGPDGNQSDDPVNNDIISHIEGINPRFMDSLGTMMESKDLASAVIGVDLHSDNQISIAAFADI